MATYTGDQLHEKLNALEADGDIPVIKREIILQKRWQKSEYPSGINYYIPDGKTNEFGRFNDRTLRTGICYTADYAYTAAAESLGRLYHSSSDKLNFTIGSPLLEAAQIYTLKTTRETKTIDLPKLLGKLRIPLDLAMGEDYTLTQDITDWAANTPGLDYDGITYISRHFGGPCTAFWTHVGNKDPLEDVGHCSVMDYLDDEQENFPDYLKGTGLKEVSGLVIVAKTLGYSVK